MKNTINIGGKLLSLEKPIIMGIMNVTPDSFHKDSRFNPTEEDFLKKANEMLENGAKILDIGGYSTRPGAENISESEEIERVQSAIEKLKSNFRDVILSVDTFRASVARAAINSGANMVNDVSGGNLDSLMFPLIIESNIPYILMHMRGTPQTMSALTDYNNLIFDIKNELFEKANFLKINGVTDIIIDPGFGFSKTLEQNYKLLKNLDAFKNENFPILVGLSRKSMIYKLLNILPEDSLNATSQLNLLALQKGAKILRVHDVFEAKQTLELYEMLENS